MNEDLTPKTSQDAGLLSEGQGSQPKDSSNNRYPDPERSRMGSAQPKDPSKHCHPERSAAQSKDLHLPLPASPQPPLDNQSQPPSKNCHPERSAAQPKDLHLPSPASPPPLLDNQSQPLPQNCHPERSAAQPKDLRLPSPESPPLPPFLLRWLTYLVFIPLMAASTIGFGCLSLLCGLWDKTGRQQHAIASAWGKSLLMITLSPVTLIGEQKLFHLPSAVYASNHLSYMDTPVLFAKLPFQFRIFAKSSLWKIPFIGWYLNRSGQVPIDQKSSRTAIAGLLRGVTTIKSGLPLVLFPEGGRAADGQLQSMMSGCAFMAIRAGVPLIPIALIGTYELLPIHTYHLTPRPLKLVVGDPIPTEFLTTRDADALTERLREAIAALYAEHSPREMFHVEHQL